MWQTTIASHSKIIHSFPNEIQNLRQHLLHTKCDRVSAPNPITKGSKFLYIFKHVCFSWIDIFLFSSLESSNIVDFLAICNGFGFLFKTLCNFSWKCIDINYSDQCTKFMRLFPVDTNTLWEGLVNYYTVFMPTFCQMNFQSQSYCYFLYSICFCYKYVTWR